MWPGRALSPVECWRGVSPIQAANAGRCGTRVRCPLWRPLRRFALACLGFDLPGVGKNSFQVREAIPDRTARELGQAFGRACRLAAHRHRAPRQNHAELREQSAQPVKGRGRLDEEACAHTLQC